MPALLTSTSTSPAAASRAATPSGVRRSATIAVAVAPAASRVRTTASARDASRPATTTDAPSRPYASAIAWPIPDVAPVTSARTPVSRMPYLHSYWTVRSRVALVDRPVQSRIGSGDAGRAEDRAGPAHPGPHR